MKDFLTVKEAAVMKNLSEGHIRQLCISGKFEGVQRHGRAWVIPEKSVRDYVPGPQGFAAEKARREAAKKETLNERNVAIQFYAAQKKGS